MLALAGLIGQQVKAGENERPKPLVVFEFDMSRKKEVAQKLPLNANKLLAVYNRVSRVKTVNAGYRD